MTLSDEVPVYETAHGAAYCGDSRNLLEMVPDGSVNLVLTSPPFALQRQKEYGNKDQSEYVLWLAEFARIVHRKLRRDGSFVLDPRRCVPQGGSRQKPLQFPGADPSLRRGRVPLG